MKYVFFCLFAIIFYWGPARAEGFFGMHSTDTKLPRTQQLIIVLTNDWNSVRGMLYAYEKIGNKWRLAFSHPVVVGSRGMGVGDGIVPFAIPGAPTKKEGDKKSPAGIFTIGVAFGYASSEEASWIKDHYVRATDTLICVDDIHSTSYNSLINNDSLKSDWKSFEQMHRGDNYYKWGLFINHNAPKPIPGHGSCIFMHIWENDHQGTVGCTAMKEEDILRVLHWIDVKSNPLLVQMTREGYAAIRKPYHLPVIQ